MYMILWGLPWRVGILFSRLTEVVFAAACPQPKCGVSVFCWLWICNDSRWSYFIEFELFNQLMCFLCMNYLLYHYVPYPYWLKMDRPSYPLAFLSLSMSLPWRWLEVEFSIDDLVCIPLYQFISFRGHRFSCFSWCRARVLEESILCRWARRNRAGICHYIQDEHQQPLRQLLRNSINWWPPLDVGLIGRRRMITNVCG